MWQPWSAAPVDHWLRRQGWPLLAPDRWWLPQALANPTVRAARRPKEVIAAEKEAQDARAEAKAAAAPLTLKKRMLTLLRRPSLPKMKVPLTPSADVLWSPRRGSR